jgi:hypothetical protein
MIEELEKPINEELEKLNYSDYFQKWINETLLDSYGFSLNQEELILLDKDNVIIKDLSDFFVLDKFELNQKAYAKCKYRLKIHRIKGYEKCHFTVMLSGAFGTNEISQVFDYDMYFNTIMTFSTGNSLRTKIKKCETIEVKNNE